jgi:tetratricopeptide (TPR) repeat protein
LARAYEHLGDLYLGPLQNPTRAETAFQEALRQDPQNTRILERLVALYEGTNNATRAIQTKTKLVDLAEGDADRRLHLLGLARLHESLAHEPRRAEQILDQLRKSHPHDFEVLRALADFYHRQGQSGAARMLLDRVLSESRRHLQSSKFDESIFHTVAQVFEIRGQNDAKAMALACRSALHHGDATLEGLGPRTLSLDIDDFLAPPSASPSLRALLVQIGEHLDSCLAGPPGDMDGTPVAPESPLAKQLEELASAAGVGPVRIHRTSKLGASVLAVRSSPPFLLVGDVLADAPVAPATLFQLVRALKLVQLHAAALARSDGTTVEAALGAWLSTLVPTWTPKGGLSSSATQMAERMAQNLPAEIPDDIVSLAKETADQLQGPLASVGLGIRTLANRAGLVCLGDPGVCIDALARLQGLDPEASGFQRTSWLARHHEGRDLIVFGISDAYVALRAQLDHPREESAG